MKNFIDTIAGEIVASKFFQKMKSIFGSLRTTSVVNDVDGQLNNGDAGNPFDHAGDLASEKIKKVMKKFGKKFKNESKATSVISKTISGITKVACVAATVVFFALVAYIIIKIIPTMIAIVAMGTALYIVTNFIFAILERGLGTNKGNKNTGKFEPAVVTEA